MSDQKRGAPRSTVDHPQPRSTPNDDPPAPHRPTGLDKQKVGPAAGEFHPPADAADVYASGGNPGDPASA